MYLKKQMQPKVGGSQYESQEHTLNKQTSKQQLCMNLLKNLAIKDIKFELAEKPFVQSNINSTFLAKNQTFTLPSYSPNQYQNRQANIEQFQVLPFASNQSRNECLSIARDLNSPDLTYTHSDRSEYKKLSNDDANCLTKRQFSSFTETTPSFDSPHDYTTDSAPAQINLHYFTFIEKRNHCDGSIMKIAHLILGDFKRYKCPQIALPHNHKSCFFYHSVKDRRREDYLYTPELCKFAESERCPKHEKCRRSHNRVERLYHSDKYKTKFCHMYPGQVHLCEYGEYCSFAHSIEDIQVRLIHLIQPIRTPSRSSRFPEEDFNFYIYYFKTEWCPFNHEHNKAQCFYAHNYQDFRRRPDLFIYEIELCEDWQSGTFITCYQEGCKRLEKCVYSHGWKEQQFHPLVYKTQPCVEGTPCFKGLECPFYHSLKDRRTLPPKIMQTTQQMIQGKQNGNQCPKVASLIAEYPKLFVKQTRQLSCYQQPDMEYLSFENNLNHVREMLLQKIAKNHEYQMRQIQSNGQSSQNVKLNDQVLVPIGAQQQKQILTPKPTSSFQSLFYTSPPSQQQQKPQKMFDYPLKFEDNFVFSGTTKSTTTTPQKEQRKILSELQESEDEQHLTSQYWDQLLNCNSTEEDVQKELEYENENILRMATDIVDSD